MFTSVLIFIYIVNCRVNFKSIKQDVQYECNVYLFTLTYVPVFINILLSVVNSRYTRKILKYLNANYNKNDQKSKVKYPKVDPTVP